MADTTSTAWRARAHSPTRLRIRTLFTLVLALAVVMGAALGVLLWLSPPKIPAFLPLWITTEPATAGVTGVVPWSVQDRFAIVDANLLGKPTGDMAANPSRDQIRLRLKALSDQPIEQPIVVYVTGPAGVDASGNVYLLGADPIGDHPRNRIGLGDILALLHSDRSYKLLVLDLWSPRQAGLAAPPPTLLSAAVARTLETSGDNRRLCLVCCSSGQQPHPAVVLGHTVFGHYLEAGLRGAADGWNSTGGRDGRVSVFELAAYVRAHVTRWSEAAAAAIQTPRLIGTPGDFTLRSASHVEVMDFHSRSIEALGAYPDWLKAAWTEEEKATFRIPRRTQALLAAEQAWAGGKPAAEAQRELERAWREPAPKPDAAMLPSPVPSLAALPVSPLVAEPKLLASLKSAVTAAEAKPLPAGTPDLPWPELEPFKAVPHTMLAAAVFTLLADDIAPPARRIRQLEQLLALQEPTPRFAETLLLRRLADLSTDAAATFDPMQAALVLRTERDFEQLAVVPALATWATPALDETYRKWRDAQAAFFSPGFVSASLAESRLSAAAAVQQLKLFADAARTAGAVRDDALRHLGSAYPAFAANVVARPAADRLADAARGLVEALQPPKEPLAADALAVKVDDWQRRATETRTALATFAKPFTSTGVATLRDRAIATDATAATAHEILAVLQTGLTPAADRAALWDTYLTLEKRLSDEVTRRDAAEDEAGTITGYRDPREPAAPGTRNNDPLDKTEQWSAVALRAIAMNELPSTVRENPTVRLEKLREMWLEQVPARLKAAPSDAAIGWIAPGADAGVSPSVRAVWKWQARRFEYESHDPLGLPVAATFAVEAARACRAASGTMADEPYLDVTQPASNIFPPDTTTATFNVGVRLVGTSNPTTVKARPLSPFPAWLAATMPASIELSPVRERRDPLTLAIAEGPIPAGAIRGILLETTLGGRTFHQRVPIALDAVTNRLGLFVAADPKAAPRPANELKLRPHGLAQPYAFALANPAPRPRSLVVRLASLGVETKLFTVEPRGLAPLQFPAPPAPAPATPPPAGQPPAPQGPDLRTITGPLEFEVFEGEQRKLVQRITVPVSLLDPSRYLAVTDVVYRPAASGRANTLTARIVPDVPLDNPPCPVEMVLPPLGNPGLSIRDGKLKGTLPTDGGPLRLYAEGLAADGVPPTSLIATLTADGSERAFTFAGPIPSGGETVRLAPFTAPLVRVRAPAFASATAPLPLRVDVDNAPAGSKLDLRLGVYADDRFLVDSARVIDTPRQRVVSLGVDPQTGAVMLKAVLQDWRTTLPVEFLVGPRNLEARLMDEAGNILAQDAVRVIFDNAPPANIEFLGLPPQIAKDKPLNVRATSDMAVSGIKEVKFFLGKPVNGAAPPGAPTVNGKLIDPKANLWEAVLPPPGVNGPVTITALFTSYAGLTGAGSQDAEAMDAADLNKPEPGVIAGKVVEGTLAQAELEVILADDKEVKARTKTKPDGTYRFEAVPPGKYKLHVEKESTNRKADADAVVKPGETTTVTLELFL